jgi:hypothetical protein
MAWSIFEIGMARLLFEKTLRRADSMTQED